MTLNIYLLIALLMMISTLHSHIYQSSYVLIITNGYLLHFIINQPNKTFLDWMMACDTLLCITNIFGIGKIFTSLIEVQNVELCYFIPYFVFFNNICNRLLTVGIVIYRSWCALLDMCLSYKIIWWGYLSKGELWEQWFLDPFWLHPSPWQSGLFTTRMLAMIFSVMFYVLCHNEMLKIKFLACSGHVHDFYYNPNDFYEQITSPGSSLRWNLPLYNPFHALTIICFCAGFIVVLLGYAAIYR